MSKLSKRLQLIGLGGLLSLGLFAAPPMVPPHLPDPGITRDFRPSPRPSFLTLRGLDQDQVFDATCSGAAGSNSPQNELGVLAGFGGKNRYYWQFPLSANTADPKERLERFIFNSKGQLHPIGTDKEGRAVASYLASDGSTAAMHYAIYPVFDDTGEYSLVSVYACADPRGCLGNGRKYSNGEPVKSCSLVPRTKLASAASPLFLQLQEMFAQGAPVEASDFQRNGVFPGQTARMDHVGDFPPILQWLHLAVKIEDPNSRLLRKVTVGLGGAKGPANDDAEDVLQRGGAIVQAVLASSNARLRAIALPYSNRGQAYRALMRKVETNAGTDLIIALQVQNRGQKTFFSLDDPFSLAFREKRVKYLVEEPSFPVYVNEIYRYGRISGVLGN